MGDGDRDAELISADAAIPDGGPRPDRYVPPRDSGPRPDAGTGEGCLPDESCNGVDDDCDGAVDETCPCLPGETASCFGGRLPQRRVGACRDGMMECVDGLEFGTWGSCEGDVMPVEEVCDAGEVDEDCDGAINEGCECIGNEPIPCGVAVGACGQGLQECIDGRRGECVGATEPRPEQCNGIDDDCDGTVDEGIVRACGTDTGECSVGTERCVAGAFEACVGGRGPVDEICDGLDNDCDGASDEELTRACGSSVGECRPGMQTCSAGTWGTCGGETLPTVELCDARDNDCDSRIDEGVTRACGSSMGVCRPGTETCSMGVFGACTGGVSPGTEACEGRLDEDCDGAVDEGCGCVTGTMRACGTDTGACQAGSQTCDASGSWGTCMGAIGPTPEVCNRMDDDCDGMVDEGGVCPTAPPVVMCPGAMTADVLSTLSLIGSGSDPDGGTVTFAWTVTARPVGSVSTPATPNRATTNFYLDASGGYTLQLCVTDDEGERACCTTNITSNAPGAINVQLSWSTAYGDVDLHLLNRNRTAPDGWWTTDDCHWANRTPDWGPAGVSGNPTLDIDDTDGFGPENISITSTPVAGTYAIGVHYFCNRSIGTGAAPGSGPTTGVVRVYCGGALIATYTDIRLDRTDDWVTVAEVDFPSCVGRSRNVRTNGTSILPSSFTSPRHCEITCTTSADCPRGERCVRASGGGPPRNICWL
jgi:hypothetical protein